MFVKKSFVYFLVFAISRIYAQSCQGGAQCIILQQCPNLYRQLQQGNSQQLTNLLRSLHCGFENENPKICCPPEFGVQPFSRNGGAPVNPYTLLPSLAQCGIQNNDRIVGGTRAEIDEHPWMALLRYDKPRGWGFYCGGVLISSKYVLTAAHCVKGEDLPKNWELTQVRLGEWNTTSSVDCIDADCSGPPQDIAIERAIPHEDYDPADIHQANDIALLRLQYTAVFNDFVKPICLPTSADVKATALEGYDMEVAGWGKTETQNDSIEVVIYSGVQSQLSGSESDVKLKVVVPVVSNAQCASVFSRVSRTITRKQMCAGGVAGQDSCRGDSGGPLMGKVSSYSNWFVFGVVSYGPSPCGTQGWPGVYTRVTEYTDWILSKFKP